MVKKIETPIYGKETLSRVRISVDELLDILSENPAFSGHDITAANGKYSFNSLADMTENKELLIGYPRISVGRLELAFETKVLKIDFGYKSMTADDTVLLEKSREIFGHYRDPLGFLQKFEFPFYLVFVAPLLSFLFGLDENLNRLISDWEKLFTYIVAGLFAAFVISKLYFLNSKSVYLAAKEGPLARYASELVVAIIAASLGGIFTKWLVG